MSELPWEKKKNENDHGDNNHQTDEKESPPEPPSFDDVPDLSALASENNDDNESEKSSDSNKQSSFGQAPDILQNAFSNDPMEEVDELETVEPEEEEEISESGTTEEPSFDDVPDLTNLVSDNSENSAGDNSGSDVQSSFEQAPNILQNAFSDEPMEEVDGLEEAGSEPEASESKPFDDVPDLSTLASSDEVENTEQNISNSDEPPYETFNTENETEDNSYQDISPGESEQSFDTNLKDSESEIDNNQTVESDITYPEKTEENEPESDKSDDASSLKNKFKSITQRRNLFDELEEAKSEDQSLAKPVNKSVNEEKPLEPLKDKFQNITHEGNLTESFDQLRKKVDEFQTNIQNEEVSADNKYSIETDESESVSFNDNKESEYSETPVAEQSGSSEPDNEYVMGTFKNESEKSQPDLQTSDLSAIESEKSDTGEQKSAAYAEKFSDLTASFKNKFKNIRQKATGSAEQTKDSERTETAVDDLTPPPLFEPDLPEDTEDSEDVSENVGNEELPDESKETGEISRFSKVKGIKPKFGKILSPFKVLVKGSSGRKSLKNQMEQMKEDIEEEGHEESSPEFVPPVEQETEEIEEGKTSKIGKISGFFKGITQRGRLRKRMKQFRENVTGSKQDDFEFEPTTGTFQVQGQYTGQPAGLSFEQVDRLVNKKLNDHQKQVKDVFDKKIDKVFSKEYMDYIASRVATNQAGDLQELQSKVNGSVNRVENFTDDLQNLSSTVDELDDRIKEIQRRNEDFESKIDNSYYSTSDRIDNLEYQLKNLQDSLGLSNESDSKLNSIGTRIDELESVLDSTQSDNQEIKSELSNIQQSISDMYGSYKELLSHLNEVNDDYESKFSDLYDKLSKIDTVESKLSEIDKNTKERDEILSKVEEELPVIKNAIKRNHKENQALANSLEELKKLSDVNRTEGKEDIETVSTGQNVQLEYIPKNSVSMRICMEWLKYLMNRVGGNNLDGVLTYYKELGWISDDVRQELLRYSAGISHNGEKSNWKLTKTDHIKSIWFIQKLAGSNFDFDALQTIEKDVNQIKENN
ncbi:FlaD/FlaE family flagellar protein [Methanohalobium sp.]|uniref:FlaD/FlaE family flagellar protein n=1 Tax=Methanohalobium sp. TaxID=2837493 RepID=UPI0025E6345D|nr:FlaD/FlaE family flagellar protein [Methanohalobium sp.]